MTKSHVPWILSTDDEADVELSELQRDFACISTYSFSFNFPLDKHLTSKSLNQLIMEHQVAPPGGDTSKGPELKLVYSLVLSIAISLVSLRLYVRACMVKKLWWDDFCLLLGLV